MRGKSFVRMKAPGMHSSGPRPKLQSGSPVMMSSPTFAGDAQFRCAVPAEELPAGLQCTLSCCPFGFPAGVFPLLKITSRSPFGSATEYEPWSKLHLCGLKLGLKKLPKKQRASAVPLISSGVDQVTAWSVDIEPKIGDSQWSFGVGHPNLKTVYVRYTLSCFVLDA